MLLTSTCTQIGQNKYSVPRALLNHFYSLRIPIFKNKLNVYFTGDGTYVSPHTFNLRLTLCIDCCLECKKQEEKMWFLDLTYKQGSKRFSGIKTY